MSHNPYTPPQSRTELSPERDDPPRPIAVWLLIILLSIFVALFFWGISRFIVGSWANAAEIGVLVASTIWRLGIVGAFIAGGYGAYRRHRWSRWFGVALIVLLAVFTLLRKDTTYYANDAERAGGYVARYVIVPLLFAWWVYALAFSRKARRYFSKPAPEEV